MRVKDRSGEQLPVQKPPAGLVGRHQQAAGQVLRPIGAAVEPGGMAAGLPVDQPARGVIPGRELVVEREMRAARGEEPHLLAAAAIVVGAPDSARSGQDPAAQRLGRIGPGDRAVHLGQRSSRAYRQTVASFDDADAVVATSWPTAYVAFNAACSGKRFYFVQDFEPHFYPVGTYSVMAENTYRMGFHGITAGAWLAQKLTREYGMDADYFPFGSDTSLYHRDPASRRSGVAFYVRSGTPRRGSELGLLALELFAKRRPHARIHLFGDKLEGLRFNCINHGPVSPAKLNDIYNQCFAGLCLSFTNVSLVPYEMLAAGCVPVVNDADHNRIVLDNPYVRYAPATPHALASALEEILDMADFNAFSRLASESVKSMTWDDAAAAVDMAFKRALNASRPPGMHSGPNGSASSVSVARLFANDL